MNRFIVFYVLCIVLGTVLGILSYRSFMSGEFISHIHHHHIEMPNHGHYGSKPRIHVYSGTGRREYSIDNTIMYLTK